MKLNKHMITGELKSQIDKIAILFFTKTGNGGTGNVWFYDMKADGFSLDDKRTPLLTDGELEKCFAEPSAAIEMQNIIARCDIPAILNDWEILNNEDTPLPERFKDRTSQSFVVSADDIRTQGYDLSINRYKEIVYEETKYEKPEEIMEQIRHLDKERTEILNQLENLIHEK